MDKTQRSTDVALRKSPSVSARVYPEGTIMEGNDGNNWTITVDSNGVHRWAKINSSKAPTPKKQMPKEDVVEQVSEVTEVQAPIISTNILQPDFIKEFVAENADNLARLNNTNKPLLIAIEDTLKFLSKRFGSGIENVEEIMVDTLIAADPIVEENVIKEEKPEFFQDLIPLKKVKVIWNEGNMEWAGSEFNTWSGLQRILKEIKNNEFDESGGTYTKVKVNVEFEDGFEFDVRTDVGSKDGGNFDPDLEDVGDFIAKQVGVKDAYMWHDKPIVVKGEKAVEMAEEIGKDIDELIDERDSLLESLEYAEGDDLVDIQNEINILNSQIDKINKLLTNGN